MGELVGPLVAYVGGLLASASILDVLAGAAQLAGGVCVAQIHGSVRDGMPGKDPVDSAGKKA